MSDETLTPENENTANDAATETAEQVVERDFAALAEQIQKLSDERDQLRDQVLRAMADFQNMKRRNEQQAIQLRKFATEELVRQLLPVLDNFGRTIEAGRNGASLEALMEGIGAVERQLRLALEGQGVQRIVSVGEPFDPEFHEALGNEHVEGVESGTVTSEIEAGYKMADRVIRPARVRVAP